MIVFSSRTILEPTSEKNPESPAPRTKLLQTNAPAVNESVNNLPMTPENNRIVDLTSGNVELKKY